MNQNASKNYQRIAKAIEYIQKQFKRQPSLDEIAAHVHLSPFHFQRLFTDWVGISPKQFLQYTSAHYARDVLSNQQSLLDTALDAGYSGAGRLHDLFVKIEAMTPGEYKSGGKDLQIRYQYLPTLFGEALIASTPRGLCYMGFVDDDNRVVTFKQLESRFPQAKFLEQADPIHQQVLAFYQHDRDFKKIKLHLKGSEFQLKVWEALLKIPQGKLTTYGEIAKDLKKPAASRAIGTAIGNNPIAYLIPCHRVIRATGLLGGYRWGLPRKTAMIGWEAANIHPPTF